VFKNLTVFRVGPAWSTTWDSLEQTLDRHRFLPCGPTQPASAGWVPPRGEEGGALVESVGRQWLMRLMTEQRVLPGGVVQQRVEELAQQLEATSGRAPGRKMKKELKEQAVLELLPMAFTKRAAVQVWIDPEARLLFIDTASAKRAEDVVTLLVKTLEGFAVLPLQTQVTPVSAMSGWLGTGEAPPTFSVDRDCELKSPDESKAVVRYARHPLDIAEVREHIAGGKLPTRVALTWEGRVSFVLTEAMQLRKLQFLDGVYDGAGQEEGFDADAAIATGELRQLLPDLVEALGGELEMAV